MKAVKRLSKTCINENEFPLDVKEILKERSERFRLRDTIFEDDKDESQGNSTLEEKEKGAKEVQVMKHIDFKRKGMDIFNGSNAGQIFDEETLYTKFIKAKSPKLTSHPIYNITRTDIYNVILKGFLKQKMHKQTVASQVSEYLFFLMSSHSSERLVEACFDTLKYQLQITSSEAASNFQSWRPPLENIISVFVNYGVSEDLLGPDIIPISKNDALVCKCPLQNFPKRNVFWVLKLISSVLFFCKNAYTIEELEQLLIIILTVSLDKHFVQMEIHENLEISKCIKRILKSYPSSESEEKEVVNHVFKLSEKIYYKFQDVNINDMYFIVSYYLNSPGFGQKLEQSLTFQIIKHKIWPNEKVSSIDEVEIKKLGKLFRKDCLVNLDYYTQYYILLHLERFITNMVFTSNSLEHLKFIRTWLLNLRISPPSIEEVVDYHLVKELITRAATIWKLCFTEVK